MPLHLSKLKSLQVLVGVKFLLGGGGGSRMEDLGEVHNLYGSLSILELQNVVDRREARKAKMRGKEHVDNLSLGWSEMKLSIGNCKDCDSLPELGQLPSLKFFSIREMHRITEVTEEFYGSLSSKKPFNSLEKLAFVKMPEWKQWHILGSGEFPKLEKLSIAS
ncbi:putative disease resistance RPP13-like protein 1 [Solanum tuberosum]|uniref:putative disease resistance RPP13-like protein 1 n=1 Tax=Solanum tuberosum TaxID=4113 RepID=UPI00073A08CB|nr:PREDICTED: putative disease resistance RPP13-like protein 1 [Solanum tuberosum]